ncbi:MAG: hypothetical protein EOO89_27425, partial [Pedobacter sp.]
MIMKNIKYLLFSLLLIAIVSGCKKDQETDNGAFHPRIFDQGLVFQSPSRIIQEGESATYNRLLFSPAPGEKTKISWTVDGTEVSTDTAFVFTPTAGGEYVVKVEATYNGQTSTRISKVLVSPSTYTRKSSAYVVMPYLSENGVAANINWDIVSHIAFNGARVLPDGGVDFSKGNQNQNIDEIVARGHINNTPVILGVTGRLSGVDGWSLYNSADFATVIGDPVKRAALVTTLATYVTDRKLDGIDVMMTDLSNDNGAITAKAAQSVGPFIAELKAALPAKSIVTATVTTNYMHWEYTSLLHADWVNVHAFETGANVGPGAPVGQQSPFWFLNDAGNLWISKGYPKNKIVLGIPAFGLRYDQLDGNGNNASWGSYGYIPYKDIIATSKTPEVETKDYDPSIAKGVYFNGIPLVTQKANHIKTNGFKG